MVGILRSALLHKITRKPSIKITPPNVYEALAWEKLSLSQRILTPGSSIEIVEVSPAKSTAIKKNMLITSPLLPSE